MSLRKTQGGVFVAACVVVLAMMTACSSEQDRRSGERLDSIEQKIAVAQQKLSVAEKAIAEAEARADAARLEAEFQSCRAQVKEVRAEVARRRAACAKDVADQSLCLARNSERTAKSGIIGCGLGIAAAIVSGGSAAPWALGGCGAGLGVGKLSSVECPAATCASALSAIDSAVIHEHGMATIPRCGGYAGFEPGIDNGVAARGVGVDKVNAGTFADSAGVAAGDVLVDVGGAAVGNRDDVEAALQSASEGEPLTVKVVRDGELYELTALASRRIGNGTLEEKLRLGVELGATVAQVAHRSGVVVGEVGPDGPAAVAGVRTGDKILRLESGGDDTHPARDQRVLRIEDVEVFLEDARAASEITFHMSRNGGAVDLRVTLSARGGRTGL